MIGKKYVEDVKLDAEFPKLFKAFLESIKDLGWDFEEINARNGTIKASHGAGFRSWGEKIEIALKATEKGTDVHIESVSAVPTTAVDWGKNKENVEKLMSKMAEIIEQIPGGVDESELEGLEKTYFHKKVNCPSCGSENGADASNCWACGASLKKT